MLEGVCITEEGATVAGATAGGLTSGAVETLMGDGTPSRCGFGSLKVSGSYVVPWVGNEGDEWPLTLCLIDWISWTSSSNLL